MIVPGAVARLAELSNLAKEQGKKFEKKRFLYDGVKAALLSRSFVGIAGLRGVGKTVILRQLSVELEGSFYLSMDAVEPGVGLFELAKLLSTDYGVKHLFVDEIHSLKGWQGEVKKIFDFLDVKMAFTSSAALEVSQSKYDLSRRVLVFTLPPFSFREYLFFKRGIDARQVSLSEIIEKPGEIYLRAYGFEPFFQEYVMGGALPCTLEGGSSQIIKNIVEKIINRDLISFGKLDATDIENVERMLRFISRSGVDVCGPSAIAKNLGITRYKAQKYLGLLEHAHLLKMVLPYGSNVLKEPKVLYVPPFRAHFAEGAEQELLSGAMREEFFVHHISNAGLELNYLKSARGEKLADYLVFHQGKKFVFEIGGAGKRGKQLKGVDAAEKHVVQQPGNPKSGIPLILFGLLW